MADADPALVAVRISRRSFTAALVVIAVLTPARAEAPAESFASWVNTLYVGAAALRDVGVDFSDRELQALFTPEVQALRNAVADRALPPSEPEGPILHILFGWGVLLNRKIEIVSVDAERDTRVVVDLTIDGNPRPLVLTGVFDQSSKAWQIDDIDYGSDGPDRTLRGRLERMRAWPKR